MLSQKVLKNYSYNFKGPTTLKPSVRDIERYHAATTFDHLQFRGNGLLVVPCYRVAASIGIPNDLEQAPFQLPAHRLRVVPLSITQVW